MRRGYSNYLVSRSNQVTSTHVYRVSVRPFRIDINLFVSSASSVFVEPMLTYDRTLIGDQGYDDPEAETSVHIHILLNRDKTASNACLRQLKAPSNRTFTPPPSDGSLFVPEIYDFHHRHNADHPLFKYDHEGTVFTVSWGEAVEAIYRATHLVRSHVEKPHEEQPVVAILAVIDQLSYFALSAGIMRAGYRVFPISPRNSDIGTANMMQKIGARYMFVSGNHAMQSLAERACKLVSEAVEILPTPTFDFLYGDASAEHHELPPPPVKAAPDDIAMILHSSGSTSFPKPIALSYRNLLQWGMQPYYGDVDICGKVLSNHSLPFFHAMGVVSLQWATMTGVVLSNFEPCDPPLVSTPDRVYSSAMTTGSRLIFCVPSFLEEWSQDSERVEQLCQFDGVMFGGAPIQKAVGDKLVEAGVKLYPFYGATEIGGCSRFLPYSPPEEGWEYFQISDHCKPLLIKQDDEDEFFRLVMLKCPSHTLAVSNTKADHLDGYDTNDLVIRHPSNPELLKIYGRADDQIMHSTGEKTNPVPIETIINRNPAINHGIIFGRGRFQAGVLIEPKPSYAFDPNDLEHLSAYRNLIWPTIEEANSFAPSHSRIFKEMILVASPSKPFQYTAKGTPRRHIIIDTYADEIDAVYKAIEKSSQEDIVVPDALDEDTCLTFVRNVVAKVMRQAPSDEGDLFQHGCDSLQTTWIRNSILRCLRSAKVDAKTIPINFVYLHPSIRALAKYIAKLVGSDSPNDSEETRKAETIAEMEAMVTKYTRDFPEHIPSIECKGRDYILLTGSTGGLGSHILERLLVDESVEKVYALNRKDRKAGKSSRDRQIASFADRGLDIALLDSPKLTFIEGDASLEGVGEEIVDEIRRNVTCIIHNAWRVDFNVALSSMEPLVAGTRCLIDLALQSPQSNPPRILFVSSIGVARNYPNGVAPEAALTDPANAVGSGYPESKWVTERVLDIAAEQSNNELRPVIVRIGQMSGGSNGSWNPHEWVPSIIKSSMHLGCLPEAPGVVSWIPVDVAASAVVEMRQSSKRYLHIVHPRPILWNDLFKQVSSKLNVPFVPYSQWLAALRRSNNVNIDSIDSEHHSPPRSRNSGTGTGTGTVHGNGNGNGNENPALHLLEFYESADKVLPYEDAEAFGFPRLSTEEAVKVAPALQGGLLRRLGGEDVDVWLGYWRSVGFIAGNVVV